MLSESRNIASEIILAVRLVSAGISVVRALSASQQTAC
jgi:hypothetical protein